MLAHKPPIESYKLVFFNEVSSTLKKVLCKYDNIPVTGNLNIEFFNRKMGTNNCLCDIIVSFSLTNIVNSKTCFKAFNGTLFELIFKSQPKVFCKICVIETEFSDCHEIIVTLLRAFFKRIPSENFVYRDYKHFN